MMNIDTAVGILCQTQLLGKKRNADLEFDLEKRKISVKYCSGRF